MNNVIQALHNKNVRTSSINNHVVGNRISKIYNSIIFIRNLLALLFTILFCGCQTTTTFKPMDINGEGRFDYNYFLQNPNWQFMLTDHNPPDQTSKCPVSSDNPEDWINSPTCTSQGVYINKADGVNLYPCIAGLGISAHMNWFPIEYDGSLYWSDHSGDDDDYNFAMYRNDKALYTANNDHVPLEFDSDETVDNWDNTECWWDRFHNLIKSDRSGLEDLNGQYAVVLGLIGLDGGHSDFSAEIHPVHGMFIHTLDDPNADKWAFFIRNWGDEGYCSSNQENLYQKTIQVVLPHENFDDVNLSKTFSVWETNFDPVMNFSYEKCKEGVLLTFTFNDPEKKGCFFGDLVFEWKGSNVKPRSDFNQNPIGANYSSSSSNSSSASKLTEKDFTDKALNARINQLDASSKKELNNLLDGTVISEKFPLFPRPKITPFTHVFKSHTNIDSIQNKILELKKENKLPNYKEMARSVPDSSTSLRKRMRRELIVNFLKEKGIK
jgi:hypothetical protein